MTVKALCLFRDQFLHIQPIEKELEGQVEFIYDDTWKEEIVVSLKPDIVIGINEFHLEVARCYKAASKLGIPTLTIQDGILEWRFMFENELYAGNDAGVPMHHPVVADKYACIGFNVASIIEGLGNRGKTEVIGMPKLDSFKPVPLKKIPSIKGKKKVLVITAAKPWFTENQKKVVLRMLNDLMDFFNKEKDFEVSWRITKRLDEELGLESSFHSKSTEEISHQILASDIVISTASTAILEAMRCGKPVAKIDYFSVPEMLYTTWNIHHKDQIGSVVEDMFNFNEQKCWHQNYLLNFQLVNDAKASKRAAELILEMIRLRKKEQDFPDKMIPYPSDLGFDFPHPSILYPARKIFQLNEKEFLKAELSRLELKNYFLEKELNKRSLGGLVLATYSKILKKIRK